ncbi:MAG TPA: hypothetical protein VKB27_06395 [Gammaproteobacteria bacterium]|nr:hypothetical protein [Gammaproteobacteria bacterium]
MSIEESGIALAQEKLRKRRLAEKDGLRSYHHWNIAYIDERIYVYLLAMAMLGLFLLWATSTSALLQYGSLGLVILLTLFWGLARISRVERVRRQRARQAREAESGNSA